MTALSLEKYLQEVKTAIQNKDIKSLENRLYIQDNFTIWFYEEKDQESEDESIVFNQITSDLKNSVNSNEFLKDQYTFRETYDRNEEGIPEEDQYKIITYNHENKIVIVPVWKINFINGVKPKSKVTVRFHPYQTQDFIPEEIKERKKKALEKIHTPEEYLAYLNKQKPFDPTPTVLGMTEAIYNFGQYIIKRGYKMEIVIPHFPSPGGYKAIVEHNMN